MKLFKQYMAIFLDFLPIPYHLYPLQVSNSRLVVDEDDKGKFRLEKVKLKTPMYSLCFSYNDLLFPYTFSVKTHVNVLLR